MGIKTEISWTDATWNIVTGCNPVSAGCDHCYAAAYAKRGIGDFTGRPIQNGVDHSWRRGPNRKFSEVRTHPVRLELPLHWRKPRRIFVCSMGDLFHENVPDEFIEDVFSVMALCSQHTFQILTKRPVRMLEWMKGEYRDALIEGGAQKIYHERTGEDPSEWLAVHLPLPNVWLGCTAENQATFDDRWRYLRDTPAALRYISYEPALGPLDVRKALFPLGHPHKGQADDPAICCCGKPEQYHKSLLDWVICGGETGPGARPMHPDWVRSLRDQCQAAGVPFHFKSWGEWEPYTVVPGGNLGGLVRSGRVEIVHPDGSDGLELFEKTGRNTMPGSLYMERVGKKAAGRLLDGREWNEFPEVKAV